MEQRSRLYDKMARDLDENGPTFLKHGETSQSLSLSDIFTLKDGSIMPVLKAANPPVRANVLYLAQNTQCPSRASDELKIFHELVASLNNKIRGSKAVISELWYVEEYDVLALALDGRMKIQVIGISMGSDGPPSAADEVNVAVETTGKRSCPELTQPNNGKATVLSEATRLLKDVLGLIERLKKENLSLLSESHYVTIEKNELKEENSALETQIEGLQNELETRVAQSKPDLNVPPPEFHHPGLTPHFPGESLGLPASDATLQQAPHLFVVPFHPNLQAYPLTTTNVSKPHARYPTPADSWPLPTS
ncbi:hypothetical protein GH714_021857 [Hevea brasiliensis]|uniref:Iron-related transcription factor 3 bHLH domain-containing protein n=1 Tax=Hevea brasiliensis TaxID=3981 RepID=A0A6A6MDK9_HEVBR|nr:hypothetical protein GH714_021857 [Hevea brasiliensis]